MASIINAATSGGLVTTADTSGILQLQTAGTTAVTVDASQRLLAGLSSNLSGARLQTQGATDTAFTAFTVNAATNDGYMGIGYGSSGSVWQIWPTYNATAGYKPLAFVVGGSEVARFPTASGFQCVNSISVGNATPTTSGAGITFPASVSDSSNANTLDDYEEGTWTPVVGGTTSGTVASYSLQQGTYTKVGRVVTCFLSLDILSSTGCVGNVQVTGLPFTMATFSATVSIPYINNFGISIASALFLPLSSTVLGLYYIPAAGGTGVTAYPVVSMPASGPDFITFFTYTAA